MSNIFKDLLGVVVFSNVFAIILWGWLHVFGVPEAKVVNVHYIVDQGVLRQIPQQDSDTHKQMSFTNRK